MIARYSAANIVALDPPVAVERLDIHPLSKIANLHSEAASQEQEAYG
jgi:hypothetical protein